jgi:hypothetical protein
MVRSDYTNPAANDPSTYRVQIPMANGFVFNPQSGVAIITENMVRHISFSWEPDYLEFWEDEQKYNARYQFVLVQGTIDDCHLLANLLNMYPFWNLEAA